MVRAPPFAEGAKDGPPSSSCEVGVALDEERFIAESAMENITSLRRNDGGLLWVPGRKVESRGNTG